MKNALLSRSASAAFVAVLLSLAILPSSALAQTNYYWDANGSIAGAGSAPTGTCGIDAFWNSDPTGGGAGSFITLPTLADTLFFVAGPAADSGDSSYTVTIDGTQSAAGLIFQASGTTLLTGGTINFEAAGVTIPMFAFGSTPSGAVTIDSAITLANSQTWTNDSSALFTVNGAVANGKHNLTIAGSGNTLITGVLGNSAGGLDKLGTGTLTMTGANTYLGTTQITAGTLALGSATSSTGSIHDSQFINVDGGVLSLVNTAGNADRILDTRTVTLSQGGELRLGHNASSNTTETIGTLEALEGPFTVTITTAANRVTTLAAAGFARNGFTTGLVRGTALGSGTTNVTRLTLADTSGLSLVGTSTSPPTTGIKNLKIIPYLLGDTSTTGLGTTFVTYDTTTGLRPLSASNATDGNYTTFGAALIDSNVFTNGSSSGLTKTQINSLLLNPTATQVLGANSSSISLTITSGAIALNAAATADSTLETWHTFILGNGEGVITVVNAPRSLNINSPIDVTSSGGLTKAGAGNLRFGAANIYTGTTTINAGTITYGVNNAIAGGDVHLIHSSSKLDIGAFSDTVGAVILKAGSITGTTGVLSSTSDFDLRSGSVSAILGGTTGLIKTGQGTVVLSGVNAYTAGTGIQEGRLMLGNADVIPDGGQVWIGNATLWSFGGFSETMGPLSTFGSDSKILLGPGLHSLTFAGITNKGFNGLTVENWTGTPSGGTNGRIYFLDTSLFTPEVLESINFVGFGTGAALLGNELIPAVVPEPTTMLGLGTLELGLFAGWKRRKRRALR